MVTTARVGGLGFSKLDTLLEEETTLFSRESSSQRVSLSLSLSLALGVDFGALFEFSTHACT